MKISIDIEIKPFNIPNYVVVTEDPSPTQQKDGIDLSDLDAETLATLCADFRAGVFARAGKADFPIER